MQRLAALALLSFVGVLASTAPASAHPLGNFTVNSYSGLRIEPTAVAVQLVVDSAEIPTLQEFPEANKRGVSPAEQDRYRSRQCERLANGVSLIVAGVPVPVTVNDSSLSFPPGNAGLHTMRLTCETQTTRPVDTVNQSVVYRDTNSSDRVGWHEITAVGDGVKLKTSDVPTTSSSQILTAYPVDLLTSPLDQREANLDITRGSGIVHGPTTTGQDQTTAIPRGVDRVTTAFTNLIGSQNLTVGFAIIAVGLAVILGAAHAFAPGHGKTLMAAYLIGRRSSLRQSATIGLSVTVTHTVGVLVLGIVLSVVAVKTPERVYPWLGLASGIMLVGIGLSLLRNGLANRRRNLAQVAKAALNNTLPAKATAHAAQTTTPRPRPALEEPTRAQIGNHHHDHDHGHEHGHGHDHGHEQEHEHDHEQEHEHGHDHDHEHGHEHEDDHAHEDGALAGVHSHGLFSHTHLPPAGTERAGARSLLAVGFAGGLVPSPSALVVLLGGIAMGRAWFGVLLVVAYGIGMALALVGTGFVLVKARDWLQRWAETSPRAQGSGLILILTRALPTLTAVIVIGAGVSVAIRAVVML